MMKKFWILLLLAGITYACGGGEASEEAEETSTAMADAPPAKEAVDGQKVYKTYCVTCHGIYGGMGANGAFNLQTSELAVAERVNVIINGRNAMTPFKEILSEDEIQAVAEYTLTLAE
jgi:mono/diheme cytochrome c family protein